MRSYRFALSGGLLLAIASAPSFASAGDLPAPDPGLVGEGQALFAQECARCHGRQAAGSSAPDIRGSIASDVASASAGMDQMPAVALGAMEIVAIAAWLTSLAPEIAAIRLRHEADRSRVD